LTVFLHWNFLSKEWKTLKAFRKRLESVF